jgi:hypothetical protein
MKIAFAPIFTHAKSVSRNPAWLRTMIPTPSPGRTPLSSQAFAIAFVRCSNCPKVVVRRSSMIAARSGVRATGSASTAPRGPRDRYAFSAERAVERPSIRRSPERVHAATKTASSATRRPRPTGRARAEPTERGSIAPA